MRKTADFVFAQQTAAEPNYKEGKPHKLIMRNIEWKEKLWFYAFEINRDNYSLWLCV